MKKAGLKLFGIEIEGCSKDDIAKKIRSALLNEKAKKFFIVTLNPEILLKADMDKEYARILNSADLKIVDGFGVKLVSFFKGKDAGARVAGADLAGYILKISRVKNLKTLFVARSGGLSSREHLERYFKKIGYDNYEMKEVEIDKAGGGEAVEFSDCDIMLVGLGAPHQEKFIWQTRSRLPKLKLAVGVGGTFDFWTGKQKRAPLFLRKAGLEWLWRLILQPTRIIRIYRATLLFLFKSFVAQKRYHD